MTKKDNILEDLFRWKLDDFGQVPPSYVWMRIQEKQQAGKRKRVLHRMRAGGIAAAVLLAFLLGWLFQENWQELPDKPLVAEQEKQDDHVPPAQVQQEKAGPAKDITPSPSISEENTASVSPEPVEKATGNTGINLHYTDRTTASEQSLELLVMADAHIEVPGLYADLKGKALADDRKRFQLTEKELLMVEINKQFQEKTTDKRSDKSWRVGALVAPAYSVNRSSYDAAYASNMSRPGEKQHVSLGGGISVEYKTGKRWSIQSGLLYSQVDQSSGSDGNSLAMSANDQLEFTFFNNKVRMESSGNLLMNASAGVIEIENLPASVRVSSLLESTAGSNELLLTSDEFEQSFEYIEIPLLVRYQLADRVWNVHMLGGFSTNILVGNNVYLKNGNGDSHIGKTKDMNHLNYSATLGVGLGYQLTNKIQLHVEPRLKYYLQSLSNNPDVNFKPYSIGIYTGVSYQF